MNNDAVSPTILFEDDALLVIDKPAGMTVNRSDTTATVTTVQDWAEEKVQTANLPAGKAGGKWQMEEGNDFVNRSGIVHRLDKETSGLLLIAKTPEAFVHLQAQFKERQVEKEYLALAHGIIAPREGEIKAPVGRLPWNRKQFGIVAGGRESVTRYKTISNFIRQEGGSNSKEEFLTLLKLQPETGRTHQIRVHLKYIGHPIFADFLYAGRKTAREDRQKLSRVFLHAAAISFIHPTSGEKVSFQSQPSRELADFLQILQAVAYE